ncbi:hypothetical protein GCM10007207_05810 [Asaia siamensis]|uniref:Transposase n=1 Tax=Asaia siamensis TaxID=110479 RepID=A0ABQ1LGE1_9PROT|nr:hypothetical protein AA0323_2048 [Asaia siamensis NRIC 0323]GGC23335.1 hypothetical protein GCM10007207_05810 [Asaia siamensis]
MIVMEIDQGAQPIKGADFMAQKIEMDDRKTRKPSDKYRERRFAAIARSHDNQSRTEHPE